MPFFKITYNANLNEDIVFTIEADSEEQAILSGDTIAWDILSSSTFVNENMSVDLQNVSQERPIYVPLRPTVEETSTQNTRGYTSLASVYSPSRNPALSNQNSRDEDCCNGTSSYTRLT